MSHWQRRWEEQERRQCFPDQPLVTLLHCQKDATQHTRADMHAFKHFTSPAAQENCEHRAAEQVQPCLSWRTTPARCLHHFKPHSCNVSLPGSLQLRTTVGRHRPPIAAQKMRTCREIGSRSGRTALREHWQQRLPEAHHMHASPAALMHAHALQPCGLCSQRLCRHPTQS